MVMFDDIRDAWDEWKAKKMQFKVVSAMLITFVLLAFAICISGNPVTPAF
jgi:hypothetical protein